MWHRASKKRLMIFTSFFQDFVGYMRKHKLGIVLRSGCRAGDQR